VPARRRRVEAVAGGREVPVVIEGFLEQHHLEAREQSSVTASIYRHSVTLIQPAFLFILSLHYNQHSNENGHKDAPDALVE
jgi:hypothetical protein